MASQPPTPDGDLASSPNEARERKVGGKVTTALFAVLLALGVATVTMLAGIDARPDTPIRGYVDQPAPPYAAQDMAGATVDLAELPEVVLVNAWATWCAPCRLETPVLQDLHERFSGDGLRVIGVSLDAAGQDEAVQAFMREFGVTYTILRDPDQRLTTVFAMIGVPVTVLIDREGIVRWRHMGPVPPDDPTLRDALAIALRD